jgi:hypothetical protein
VPSLPGPIRGHTDRPCHYRAIRSSPDRSPADNHGQHLGGIDLHISWPPQARPPRDLALQQGSWAWPLPRRPWRLADEQVATEDGPHPPAEAEPTAPRCARGILTGHVTSVPFTAVLNGPERTITDNHEAASTCAIPRPRRSQQRPNWLWEEEVIAGVAVRQVAGVLSYFLSESDDVPLHNDLDRGAVW